jgi:hypothetical protein
VKSLSILIRAELEIPDEWELVEHPSGMQVLKVGDRFVDFDIAPLLTKSTDPDAEWSDADSDRVGEILERVLGVEVDLEIRASH